MGSKFACITATQARSIYAVTFEVDQGQIRVKADRIPLDFMPQSVVHLGDERFLRRGCVWWQLDCRTRW